MTCFIITKSIVFIIIKPWKCGGTSILPSMENVEDQTTLCMDLSQYKLIEWWCKCKGNVKSHVIKNISNLTTYVQTLRTLLTLLKVKAFFDTLLRNNFNLLSHEWWDLIGVSGCTFAPITHHVLTQVCFTLSCERYWNSYSFVHNKVRHWLIIKHAKNLVYICNSNKVLQKWLSTNPTT